MPQFVKRGWGVSFLLMAVTLIAVALWMWNSPPSKNKATPVSEISSVSPVADVSQALSSAPLPEAPDIPQRIEDIDFASYSTDLARFSGLNKGDNKAAAIEAIHAFFKPEKGAKGQAAYTFLELGGLGGTVIIASADGLADDSVKARELYAVFRDDSLITYGMKVKCWRGDRSDVWIVDLCP